MLRAAKQNTQNWCSVEPYSFPCLESHQEKQGFFFSRRTSKILGKKGWKWLKRRGQGVPWKAKEKEFQKALCPCWRTIKTSVHKHPKIEQPYLQRKKHGRRISAVLIRCSHNSLLYLHCLTLTGTCVNSFVFVSSGCIVSRVVEDLPRQGILRILGVCEGFLRHKPPDPSLESASPCPPQGSIWWIDSTSIRH